MTQPYPRPTPVYAGGVSPQPPRPRRTGRKVVAVVVAIVAVIIAISAVAHASHPAARHGATITSSGNTAHPPQADVSAQACAVDEFGLAKATLIVTNHSSRASDYTLTVEFVNDRGTRLAEGAGMTTAVAAGQTVQLEVMGDQQLRGPVSCHVTKVDRYAS